MGNAFIEIKHLVKSFGDLEVLKDINVTINEGKVVCIIGPSGSGKSTFLRCINQLETPTKGEILYQGEDLCAEKADIRRFREEVGMVFQRFNLFPLKTVLDNVTMAPILTKHMNKKEAEEKAIELLKKVGLESKKKAKPDMLSGGQQQRVAIARALAMEPKALLFDEPTSALDPISTAKIEELMEELKKQYTIVIVTHNMQQALRVSDYTAFFLTGEMVEYADTATLFSYPQDKRTEDYITGRFG